MDELEKLKKENEELKKMNDIKSDWISISTHGLRTSLSATKWILKMFLDKDFGSITSEQEGFMKKAYDSNERMLALVNDMLSVNHTQDAVMHMQYHFEEADILPLVDEVIFDFHGESFKKKVGVIFLRPPTPVALFKFDKNKVCVVLQNLIENAIKYSNAGDSVIVSVRDQEDKIILSVKDNGIGIPPVEKEHIFEKFFRATNAKEKDDIGSGLGLYTTKSIIENHGGTIWFESEIGQGTTFFFSLPKSPTETVATV